VRSPAKQPLAATCLFCYLIGGYSNDFHSALPSLWRRTLSRDFSHNRLAIRPRSTRPLDEILPNRTNHRRRALSHTRAELLHLSVFGPTIRRGQLGASSPTATLRLG